MGYISSDTTAIAPLSILLNTDCEMALGEGEEGHRLVRRRVTAVEARQWNSSSCAPDEYSSPLCSLREGLAMGLAMCQVSHQWPHTATTQVHQTRPSGQAQGKVLQNLPKSQQQLLQTTLMRLAFLSIQSFQAVNTPGPDYFISQAAPPRSDLT